MSAKRPFLPYGRQDVDEDDIAAVVAVLRSDRLTQGPKVEEFETALARRVGADYAVVCANGTAALHLAGLALDFRAGDAVVVPAVTFLATANGPHSAGAEVAFADVDPETGLMGVREAEAAILHARRKGWRVRALLPVDFAGQVADIDGLARLAAAHGAVLIEDACHALGATDRSAGRETPVGASAHGGMTVFSFHPVKTVATGEGGAVTTQNPDWAKRLALLRNHGMSRDPEQWEAGAGREDDGTIRPWHYEMAEPGFNYRLTDLQCALGLSQLSKLDAFVARRRVLADLYRRRLASSAPAIRPLAPAPWCAPAWHLQVVQIDFAACGRNRTQAAAHLQELGIGCQVHYIPLHLQPYWRRRYGALRLPGAELFYRRALSLPLFPAMADDDVDRVTTALVDFMGACG